MRILLLLAALLCLTGCVTHEISITNTTKKDCTFTQSVPGGEHAITLHPGASVSFPASTPINFDGLRVEYH